MTCRECDLEVYARSLCRIHYQRQYRTGSTERKTPVPKPPGFRGLGILTCKLCGDPMRDHDIGPCPNAGVGVFRR